MADIELKKKPSMDEEEQLVTKQRKNELKQEKKNEKEYYKHHKRMYKLTVGDVIFNICNYTVFILFTILCIFPFYYLFINTISSNDRFCSII